MSGKFGCTLGMRDILGVAATREPSLVAPFQNVLVRWLHRSWERSFCKSFQKSLMKLSRTFHPIAPRIYNMKSSLRLKRATRQFSTAAVNCCITVISSTTLVWYRPTKIAVWPHTVALPRKYFIHRTDHNPSSQLLVNSVHYPYMTHGSLGRIPSFAPYSARRRACGVAKRIHWDSSDLRSCLFCFLVPTESDKSS